MTMPHYTVNLLVKTFLFVKCDSDWLSEHGLAPIISLKCCRFIISYHRTMHFGPEQMKGWVLWNSPQPSVCGIEFISKADPCGRNLLPIAQHRLNLISLEWTNQKKNNSKLCDSASLRTLSLPSQCDFDYTDRLSSWIFSCPYSCNVNS